MNIDARCFGYDPADSQLRDLRATIDALRAEVERLRAELVREEKEHDMATSFHAVAVKERDYERALVERLRAYLPLARAYALGIESAQAWHDLTTEQRAWLMEDK